MAVTQQRKPRDSAEPLHPEEALTPAQALRMYTMNNARIMKLEDQIGSLEPGKLADLIVVDRDPLTSSPDELMQTKVLRTYVDGKLVYERK
jgi:predicted amidohydrolase YtcJ